MKPKKVSTFQEFESNTSDAWDVGEDDDELLAMAAESLNTEVVMETANRVIQNHSRRQERYRVSEERICGDSERPERFSDLPSVTGSDSRLVKSVSESHTSHSAGNRVGGFLPALECPGALVGQQGRDGPWLLSSGPLSGLSLWFSLLGQLSGDSKEGTTVSFPSSIFLPPMLSFLYVSSLLFFLPLHPPIPLSLPPFCLFFLPLFFLFLIRSRSPC